MIKTSSLTKKFNSLVAVDNLNLHIKKGEIFGFIGPNGAGKTTTIKMMVGILPPTKGKAGGILAAGLSLSYIFVFNFILFSKPKAIFSFSFPHAYIWLISIISIFIFTGICLSRIDKYQF